MITVADRLERIESMLVRLFERQVDKEFYDVHEFARIVGRSLFTCREWCRNHRVRATKKKSGRGPHAAWSISHAELRRYQQEGLLPERSPVVESGLQE